MSNGQAEKKRKSVMLDAQLVDKLKEIAMRHGMPLSSYLRALLNKVVELENSGIFAPLALRRMLVYEKLRRGDIILMPLSALNLCKLSDRDAMRVRETGRRIGELLREVGVSFEDLVNVMFENLSFVFREPNRIIILSGQSNLFIEFVYGVAEAYSASIKSHDNIIEIEFKNNL